MMRKSVSLLLTAVLLVLFCFSAAADTPLVIDDAGILSQEEAETLEAQAEAVSEEYDFGVYVVTIDNFLDLEVSDSIEETAEALYEYMEFGTGDAHCGVMLMLSMENRKFAIYYDGDDDNAFDGAAQDYLQEQFLDDFGDDEWYEGFEDYIDGCSYILENAAEGITLEYNPPHARTYGVIVCILLGFLIAFIVTMALKSQLNSVSEKSEAAAFIAKGGLNLSVKRDVFLYKTEDRVYDPPEKESSSDSDSDSGSSSGSF